MTSISLNSSFSLPLPLPYLLEFPVSEKAVIPSFLVPGEERTKRGNCLAFIFRAHASFEGRLLLETRHENHF